MRVNAIIKAVKEKQEYHFKKNEKIDYILLEPMAYEELTIEMDKDYRLRRVDVNNNHISILGVLIVKDNNPTDNWLKVVKK